MSSESAENPPEKDDIPVVGGNDDIDDEEAQIRLKLPEILCYDEIDRFVAAIDDLEDLFVCRAMLFGGLRLTEGMSVRPMDLDPDRSAVFVNQGKMGKDRWAYLDLATIAIGRGLAKERKIPADRPIWSKSDRTLQRHVAAIYARAGITWEATCHTLRHTCATMQLDRGVDLAVVQANMGHSDITTTQIYLHLDIKRRSELCRDAFRWGV